ncbi:hypothetical protein GWK36_07260 [Caldichromatium japonicum]|uniref:Pyruvate carboxyltransferase domain-containing protein n=1 Tax=Caldichromatium japonicum TaxID=2699430 RepID=A0A6G7VCW8_9GAMM|nr:hypothetical protein [Caldichromatium japonicum]QIK37814.1 hypothetical protein GWK36_07260 [Caldichromatium japonicum]
MIIYDTTLHDGEQSVGVALARAERLAIAGLLDARRPRDGGWHPQVGIPAMGEVERDDICTISALGLAARLMVWSRLNAQDIATCAWLDV